MKGLTDDELEKFRKAGKIASEAREYGKSLIKIGASLLEVCDLVEKKIKDLGGEMAFPVQISRNQIAAHYCPTKNDRVVFQKGDIVKIDVGVHVDGYVGDTAATVNLAGEKYDKLVRASREALDNAIKAAKPGITTGEMGKIIGETIEKHGFKPIRNLSGHGVGKFIIHGPPSIPNYDNGTETKLIEGEVIAIEPFATDGAGKVEEETNAEVFMLVDRKPVRNLFVKEVLKEIDRYDGLPFTTRWLTKKISEAKVSYAINELQKMEMIQSFPPLPDMDKVMVSQAEHTIIVGDKAEILTR